MSRLLDTRTRTDEITRAVVHLLATGGASMVTTRAVAGIVGISVGTLAAHLSNKDRMLRVCSHTFARQRLQQLGRRVEDRGVQGFLPLGDDETYGERAWLAYRDLARTTRLTTVAFQRADLEERFLLSRVPELAHVDPMVVDALHATTQGLCAVLCGPAVPDERCPVNEEWARERLAAVLTLATR